MKHRERSGAARAAETVGPDSPVEARSRLAAARPVAWPAAREPMERLTAAGHEAWLVGGSVRDVLRGVPPSHPDIATDAPPDRLLEIFPRAIPTGIRHGTVTVLSAGAPVEITTFRVESDYADARHPDQVRFVRTIEEDLTRRDFTINAMAYQPARDLFLDPFDGLADLKHGVIRAVGEAADRFGEDGLRPFRAVRFAATLEFDLHPATAAAIPLALEPASRVAPERVREELNRMLLAATPSRAIELLRTSGLLALVIPELIEGYRVHQNRFHAWDVYHHSLAVLDAAPAGRLSLRLAALLHDIGKPRTKAVVDGEGTFYNHQHVGSEMAREILERLRYSREMTEEVVLLVDQHMFHYQEAWSDAAVRRFIRRVGVEHVADLFDLRLADSLGNGLRQGFPVELGRLRERVDRELAGQSALSLADLRIDGRQVMEELGIPPGRRVGEALDYLLDRVIEDPGLNETAILARLLREKFVEKP